MPVAYQLLETSRITQVIQALQDARQVPKPLKFLQRTPVVRASDGEVLARYVYYNTVADIVADDQKAAVYNSGKLTFESIVIPNVKKGTSVRQEMLNMLQGIASNPGFSGGMAAELFTNYRNTELANLLRSIDERMETMIIGMQLDSFSYDRFGIKLSGISWGMPADLKVTTSVTWDTPSTATPITDILTQRRYANVRYGANYDRATMSFAALIYLIGTTEFANKARFVLSPAISPASLVLQDMGKMQDILANILGMNLEIYDSRSWQQNEDGTSTSFPFLPITKVILSDSADDNNPAAMNMANAIVTESLVADMVDTPAIGSFGGPRFGPVSYVTPASADLNPPGLNMWGVSRCFPRKNRLQTTSVLTVGAFSDPIPYTTPF